MIFHVQNILRFHKVWCSVIKEDTVENNTYRLIECDMKNVRIFCFKDINETVAGEVCTAEYFLYPNAGPDTEYFLCVVFVLLLYCLTLLTCASFISSWVLASISSTQRWLKARSTLEHWAVRSSVVSCRTRSTSNLTHTKSLTTFTENFKWCVTFKPGTVAA